jgi:hypothetical protein
VLVRNLSVASAEQTVVLENVEGLRFENVTVAGQPVRVPSAGVSPNSTETEREVHP